MDSTLAKEEITINNSNNTEEHLSLINMVAKVSIKDSSPMHSYDESKNGALYDENGDRKLVDVPCEVALQMSRRQMKKIVKNINKSNRKTHARLRRKVQKENEKYKAIVPPEGFSIVVNGVCLDLLIPSKVKSKYLKICAYHGGEKIHSNIIAGVLSEEAVMAIKKVVRLAEKIRNVTLYVRPSTLNIWLGEIYMLRRIGLKLGFMEDHVMKLRSTLCRHKAVCKCKSLMDQMLKACHDLRRSRRLLKMEEKLGMPELIGEMMRVELHEMQYIERVGARLNKFGAISAIPL